jgi:mannose-6-phosphate isomerase-like protein (cupin superfamily)
MKKASLVRYRTQTNETPCPYGNVQRIVTGGEGGIANVHVVSVTQGDEHLHEGYDEVYYVLSGNGSIVIDGKNYRLEPGAVATIPAGMPHRLASDSSAPLEFIIFGTPPMSMDNPRARPMKP